ncbi:hypothetical protein DFH07DRAFT_967630 [Mycena maculata]|uniref:Uncharacterized protein n=1 Tax=Mycena maculata TaxID=230809 RepID=A0AAD7MX22_9AGAR|nr:hypothetical protein DFH07DRAFT_967630 [Mycena maculata]
MSTNEDIVRDYSTHSLDLKLPPYPPDFDPPDPHPDRPRYPVYTYEGNYERHLSDPEKHALHLLNVTYVRDAVLLVADPERLHLTDKAYLVHLAQKIERVMETFAIAYDRRLITSPPLATWIFRTCEVFPWPLEIRVPLCLSRPVDDHPPHLFSFASRQERDLALKVLDTPAMHHYVKCLVARVHNLPQQVSDIDFYDAFKGANQFLVPALPRSYEALLTPSRNHSIPIISSQIPTGQLTYPTLDLLIRTTSQELHKNKTDLNYNNLRKQVPPHSVPRPTLISPQNQTLSIHFKLPTASWPRTPPPPLWQSFSAWAEVQSQAPTQSTPTTTSPTSPAPRLRNPPDWVGPPRRPHHATDIPPSPSDPHDADMLDLPRDDDAPPSPPVSAPASPSDDQRESEVDPHSDEDDHLIPAITILDSANVPAPPAPSSIPNPRKRRAPGPTARTGSKRAKHAATPFIPPAHIPIQDGPNETQAHYGCHNCIAADRCCDHVAVGRRCPQCVTGGDSHCTFALSPPELATRLRNLGHYSAATPYATNEAARNHIRALEAQSNLSILCERATTRLAVRSHRLACSIHDIHLQLGPSALNLDPPPDDEFFRYIYDQLVARELRGDPIVYSDVPHIVSLAALYPDPTPPSHLLDQPVAGPSTLQ